VVFGPVAFAFDDARVGMMEEPVEQRGGKRRVVIEDFRPVLERAIGAHEDGAALVAFRDNLEQQIGTELVDRKISCDLCCMRYCELRCG
jgi:hypothetical protein